MHYGAQEAKGKRRQSSVHLPECIATLYLFVVEGGRRLVQHFVPFQRVQQKQVNRRLETILLLLHFQRDRSILQTMELEMYVCLIAVRVAISLEPASQLQ
jgi:hypothetical protein